MLIKIEWSNENDASAIMILQRLSGATILMKNDILHLVQR